MVIIENDPSSHLGGFGLEEYLVEEEEDDHEKKGKKGKKGKKKKGKKSKKIMKKIKPMLIGAVGLKLLFYHFLMKKMVLLSLLSFLLSKASFILASLVALKQFFHTPTQHRSNDSNKLEVVHIPIRKLRRNKHRDENYDESKFIPITHEPETVDTTTPFYYDFPYRPKLPETFSSSDEDFVGKNSENFRFGDDVKGNFNEDNEGNLNENFNFKFKEDSSDKFEEIYNEHFKNQFEQDKKLDEKTFYKNRVYSPFV